MFDLEILEEFAAELGLATELPLQTHSCAQVPGSGLHRTGFREEQAALQNPGS